MSLLRPLMVPLLPMVEPALDLDLTAEFVDPRITFTRASTRTYFDSAGILRTAAVNEWPREYDPATVTRVNLLTFSQNFDNAAWVKNQTTVTANAAQAPDGTMTADFVEELAGTNNHDVNRFAIGVAGTTMTTSAYFKGVGRDYCKITVQDGSDFVTVFRLSTLTVHALGAGCTATIAAAGNGWVRCSVTRFASALGTTRFSSAPDNGSPGSFLGEAGKGIHLWGAQIEIGAVATDYIPTLATPLGDGVCLGRAVWGARTNLTLRSTEFDNASWTKFGGSIVANAALAPDPTLTADKLVESVGEPTTDKLAQQNFTIPAAVTRYAFSIFAKAAERTRVQFGAIAGSTALWPTATVPNATFDLSTGTVVSQRSSVVSASVQRLPNGWFRLEVVATSSGTGGLVGFAPLLVNGVATQYAGDGVSGLFIWGAQLEVARFASPYIPTTTAPETRAADAPIFNNIDSFGFNPAEGTFSIDATTSTASHPTETMHTIVLDNGAPTNLLRDGRQAVGGQEAILIMSSNSVSQVGLLGATPGNSVTFKRAFTYAASGGLVSQSGLTRTGYGAVTLPVRLTRMSVGYYAPSSSSYWHAPIKRIRYWPLRLTQQELNGITA